MASYLQGSGSGEGVFTPVNLNLYGYARQRPIVAVDPDGRSTYVTADPAEGGVYNVTSVVDDGDLGIYVLTREAMMMDVPIGNDDLVKLGETMFSDAFVLPTGDREGQAEGRVIIEDFSKRFFDLAREAKSDTFITLAYKSRGGGKYDVKTGDNEHGAMDAFLLNGRFMTLREIGNYLAGYNAAQNGQTWEDFQRTAGGLHVCGKRCAAEAFVLGKEFGPAPNYGEIDYQRTRSAAGFALYFRQYPKR